MGTLAILPETILRYDISHIHVENPQFVILIVKNETL